MFGPACTWTFGLIKYLRMTRECFLFVAVPMSYCSLRAYVTGIIIGVILKEKRILQIVIIAI
jgi:dolichyl-phosphate-mannose--protein O-mannosyl transferase